MRFGKNVMWALVFMGLGNIATKNAFAEYPPGDADVFVYGPGGPAAPMVEAAAAFEKLTGETPHIKFGFTPQWSESASKNADLIYAGSEHMMDTMLATFPALRQETVRAIYLRPVGILVRRNNPKRISGLKDLIERKIPVMVVSGSGQVGLWEDVIGRTGHIDHFKKFRSNIVFTAPYSGKAKQRWIKDKSIEAWLIWNHWQIDHPDINADYVPLEKAFRIYRPLTVGLTTKREKQIGRTPFREFFKL